MNRNYLRRVLALAPLPAALLLRAIALNHPALVERVFSAGVYPYITRIVSTVMAICPVPIIELLIIAYLPVMMLWLRRRRFLRVAAVTLLIPALFLGGWGLHYLRLPLEETLSLPVRPSSTEELTSLCDQLVATANESHTAPTPDVLASVPAAIDAAAENWPIPSGGFPAPKFALSSPLLSRFLIEGVTSPWTLEALVNRTIPPASLPFTACHEAAHVRGFAREEDASLVAFLACSASDEPFFRYSGTLAALLETFAALRNVDVDAYATCRAKVSPAVEQDIATHASYWAQYRSTKTADIGHQTNDAYLHAVSGGDQGVRSYGRLVDLLLALSRKGEF